MEPSAYSANEIYDALSPERQKMLVSLPYRAGLYVSFSDVTGGWDAQEAEIQSLTEILRGYAMKTGLPPFSQKVLMDCLAERGAWPSWSKDIGAVPSEASSLVDDLVTMMGAGDLSAFKGLILDIALGVAMAFRETADGAATAGHDAGFFQSLLSSLIGGEEAHSALDHLNISAAEREALSSLSAALGHRL
ncbi:MAG: hypothetical protein DI626_06660 [Micavibrio aeruginosavorus]|uniref:Uncharacterized protein n=1 Tax=Micavibrio aeruginosavorus TaxID=349221 RepID=A0A2W4ZZ93_9BACT|nr:MAG: hypothetical protein DI626_06660 [Micavibrio aeruginosavorus]